MYHEKKNSFSQPIKMQRDTSYFKRVWGVDKKIFKKEANNLNLNVKKALKKIHQGSSSHNNYGMI